MSDEYAARLKAERVRKNAERQARMAAKIADIEAKGQARKAKHEQAIARHSERADELAAELTAKHADGAARARRYGGVYGRFAGRKGSVTLRDGIVKVGVLGRIPVEHAAVSLESGGRTRRVTATRVVGGAVLAGPLGAAAGALARKKIPGSWLLICDTRTGHVDQVPVMEAELGDAAGFVAAVESAQQLS